jgi:glycosyltransferase involved in cell wall biosynthesis
MPNRQLRVVPLESRISELVIDSGGSQVRKLRVLLAHYSFKVRGGAELYLRDLAIGLMKRGHLPIVFSPESGDVAREIRALTIPVIDDLKQLADPPDVIHGQDHLSTVRSLLHFPGVPAVFVCHGWVAWQAAPPQFPRIHTYVAVDYTSRDRLICEHGIPADRVRVQLNFVDLQRFAPRGTLPARPMRALVFSNYATETRAVAAMREACARTGIALDVVGEGVGRPCPSPEDLLGEYDLVFAKGRSALEAAAVGTAVVLCDVFGLGSMITMADFDRLRAFNFGLRSLQSAISAESIAHEIARYDPIDALRVSQRVRAEADLESAIDRMIQLYEEAADQHGVVTDEAQDRRAAAEYLKWLEPFMRDMWSWQSRAIDATAERERFAAETLRLETETQRLVTETHRLVQDNRLIQDECLRLRAELNRVHRSRLLRFKHHLGKVPLLKRSIRLLSRLLTRRDSDANGVQSA